MRLRELSRQRLKLNFGPGGKVILDPCIRYELLDDANGVRLDAVEVGVRTRVAFAKTRKHVMVLRPTPEVLIELNGADDWRKSGVVVWRALNHGKRTIVRTVEDLPSEYRVFAYGPFTKWITGRGAKGGVGIAIPSTDHEAVVQLALIRESNKPGASSNARSAVRAKTIPRQRDVGPKGERIVSALASFQGIYLRAFLYPVIGNAADKHVGSRDRAFDLLRSPARSLSFLLTNYAFARAGGEQAGYGEICDKLLSPYCGDRANSLWDGIPSGVELWNRFRRACTREGIGLNEKLNRGVIEGLYTLASPNGGSGLVVKLANDIKGALGLTAVYRSLKEVPGVGPKIAAFICRDVVFLADLENQVSSTDAWMLQPVDVWTRRVAEFLDRTLDARPDEDVARFLTATAEAAGTSGIAFNQGSWFFGSQVARKESRLSPLLDCLGA
jgi:hypothetical protein